jgi:nucleoside phosphorylase
VAGVFRDRMPLPWLLYLAGLEGRLVWQDSSGFAVLEPPLARPEIWRRPRSDRVGVLRWADRHWGNLMFATTGLVLLLVTLGLALAGQRLAALGALLLTLLYVSVVLTAMLVWQFVTNRRDTAQRRAVSSIVADQWTMPLFHQEREQRIDELLERVRSRLLALVKDEVQRTACNSGAEIGPVRPSMELAYPHTGVTTAAAAERVAAWFPVVFPEVSMRGFDRRPDDPARGPFRPVPFVRLYFTGVAVAVVVVASLVTGFEAAECGTPDRCAAALTSYGQALPWALYRLIGQNPPRVVPVSGYTLVLGWLLTLLAITAIGVVIVAVSVQLRATREEKAQIVTQLSRRGRTRVLLVTVADEERDAVLDTIEHYTGRGEQPRFDGPVPVFEVGTIGDTEIFVVQVAQGVSSAGGAIVITGDAIVQLDPHYALIVGMCYGLRPDRQRLGDILVSEKIRDLDHGKLVDPPAGPPVEVLRGESVNPSPLLVTRIRAACRGWSRTRPERPVQVGLMLAWSKLVNSESAVRQLRDQHPDAIGADMEGAGFYAATRAKRVESVLIKGVCDWGHGREADSDALEVAKRAAARNASEFVLHLVLAGVFAQSAAGRHQT